MTCINSRTETEEHNRVVDPLIDGSCCGAEWQEIRVGQLLCSVLKLQVSPSLGKKRQNRLSSGKLATSFLLLNSSHCELDLRSSVVPETVLVPVPPAPPGE